MAYKGLVLFALLFVCVVRAERFAQLSDLLARYDPYTGKIRAPVHLNYGVDTNVSFKGIVIPKHCNVYEGPAVSHKVVGVLSQFDKVKVVGEVVFTEYGEEAKHAWYKIGDKQFVMEHYIFNKKKAGVESSDLAGEDDSDVKKDINNHVEVEKPKVAEVKAVSQPTQETATKESMADMAKADTTDSIVNGSDDDNNSNDNSTTNATATEHSTENTSEDNEGSESNADTENSNETENATTEDSQTENANTETSETESTTTEDSQAESTNAEASETENNETENNETETSETENTTTDATSTSKNNEAEASTAEGSETTESATTTADGEGSAAEDSAEEAPADVTAAGDIFDEEADG